MKFQKKINELFPINEDGNIYFENEEGHIMGPYSKNILMKSPVLKDAFELCGSGNVVIPYEIYGVKVTKEVLNIFINLMSNMEILDDKYENFVEIMKPKYIKLYIIPLILLGHYWDVSMIWQYLCDYIAQFIKDHEEDEVKTYIG